MAAVWCHGEAYLKGLVNRWHSVVCICLLNCGELGCMHANDKENPMTQIKPLNVLVESKGKLKLFEIWNTPVQS